jgi:cell division protein FtsB
VKASAGSISKARSELEEARRQIDEDLNELLTLAERLQDGPADAYIAERAKAIYGGEGQ